MKTGLFALGIGMAVQPAIVRSTAEHAERAGFSTLWVGEHVVLFDRHESKYPYSAAGNFPLPADADWLDPFITLTFAAAVTSKIRLATGICLVPEQIPSCLASRWRRSIIFAADALRSGWVSDGRPKNLPPSVFRLNGARRAPASTSR